MQNRTVSYPLTIENTPNETDLLGRFQVIYHDRMRKLPICNSVLEVEVVGFEAMAEHRLGILITPWFMNLILLAGDKSWSELPDGATDQIILPAETCAFTVCRDDALGAYLSAVLFRSMKDFPDQQTAVAVACEILQRLRQPAPARHGPRISRRGLLSGMRSS